ncbi:MAG: polysaccharide biosynthesis protein [Methylococcaceae bacterium]|nr:polysaccharide biosynthesis protein [Methylococcaceae bacterium]
MKIKFRSRTTIFIHDLVMVVIAWWGAYWLRFNFDIPSEFVASAWRMQTYVVCTQSLIFWLFGLYRGVWRFSSLPDLFRILKAVLIGITFIGFSLSLYNGLAGVPGAVLILYVFLSLVLVSVPRFCYRFWKESILQEADGQRVLVVGAGVASEMLVRDLQGDHVSKYIPIALVDDDPAKRRREIRGLRVVGQVDDIPRLIEQYNIAIVLIAIPSATDAQMRRIVEHCERCHIPFLTLPSVKEMLTCQVSGESLRDVSIKDILGREPVRLNWTAIKASLKDKCILVTGGGGSIGSELCKQVARINPAQLIIFDQSEFSLYELDAEISRIFPALKYEIVLGDVTDRRLVKKVIQQYRPDVIFHAAAYKHVPLLEKQISQAVFNNVVGTKVVAEEAMAANVERFILISTDKAVNPENVMGATKRAAEILCQYFNHAGITRFITVRFGNVLDSAGSVVPIFRAQIKAGGPVTVTHPDISRYFMTIPEACQLIMKAETVGDGGEIFVLDMGQPIKIAYLAEQMILLSGKQPHIDIAITYIGLRSGEKLHEELFYNDESLLATGYEKLLLAKAFDQTDPITMATFNEVVAACELGDDTVILAGLKKLVPEFKHSSH